MVLSAVGEAALSVVWEAALSGVEEVAFGVVVSGLVEVVLFLCGVQSKTKQQIKMKEREGGLANDDR